MTENCIDPTITAEVIHEAITEYRSEADNDDWWHTVTAPGYPHGVDVNIYVYYGQDGIAIREAHCYPNVEYQRNGETFVDADTDRLVAIIPERDWLPPTT